MIIAPESLYRALYRASIDLDELYQSLGQRLILIVNQYKIADGTIPQDRLGLVLAAIGKAIESQYVGLDGRNAYAADGITALSPYSRFLNLWTARTIREVTEAHAVFMQERLPPNLYAWYYYSADRRMPHYDPVHTWVDPNGYRLSDRIWRTAFRTREQLDRYIASEIGLRKSAVEISTGLDRFIKPGHTASFDGMRLARTEITRAHGAAMLAANASNPFVTGTDWRLSSSHPRQDVCDRVATMDGANRRLRAPYPAGRVPRYPAHPFCLCQLLPAVSLSLDDLIDRIKARFLDGDPAPLTPASPYFTEALLAS